MKSCGQVPLIRREGNCLEILRIVGDITETRYQIAGRHFVDI